MKSRVVIFAAAFALCGASAIAGTPLSDLAASLKPGNWERLATDADESLVRACESSGRSITEYATKAVWDGTRNEFHFVGQGHTDCAKHIRYRESTNSWTLMPSIPSTIKHFGHAYEHNAMNPETGRHFFRGYNSLQVDARAGGSSSWGNELPAIPWGENPQVAGALEYFPEMGGLIFADRNIGVWFWKESTSEWSQLASNGAIDGIGKYNNFATYSAAHRRIFFGGGNSSTFFAEVTPDGTVNRLTALPTQCGPGDDQALVAMDPVSGNPLVMALSGSIHEYDPGDNRWRTNVGSHPLPESNDDRVGTPIPEYGVIMFIENRGPEAPPYVWLYRHKEGVGDGPPDAPPPPDNTDDIAPAPPDSVSVR